jgi:ADP-ribose pyrophosphatase
MIDTFAKTKHFTTNDVEILEEKTAFQGYFHIHHYKLRYRLFSGNWSNPIEREVFQRGKAVGALLYDPILHKIVLIEQFRPGALCQEETPWLLELVAGIIDAKDESAEQVAIREAQEEAGLMLQDILPICTCWVSPGGSQEKITLFCARVDASRAGGVYGLADEGENIKVWPLDVAEVYSLLDTGLIRDAATIIGIQWFKLHEAKIREEWA